MPRRARIVAPGVAHHITQRGTDHQTVFFSQRDRLVYLDLLTEQSRLTQVKILGYCLMTNHIHLVVVPDDAPSLAECLQRVHGRYAQYLNARRQRSGHLWQNRFFSCPLDDDHLWAVLRYVERNPVRAHMVAQAWDHPWSSARIHLGDRDTRRLLDLDFWHRSERAENWRQVIEIEEDESERRRIRRATFAGQPLGSEDFVKLWQRQPIHPQTLAA